MVATDWTKIYKNYQGLWVALKDDEQTVIASGKSLEETSKKALKKGYKDPIFMQVPQKTIYFVGNISKSDI
ncbi:MAG: DUF5678 domain-containing protein [Candidatus Daviesbacteria bacterium]